MGGGDFLPNGESCVITIDVVGGDLAKDKISLVKPISQIKRTA